MEIYKGECLEEEIVVVWVECIKFELDEYKVGFFGVGNIGEIQFQWNCVKGWM